MDKSWKAYANEKVVFEPLAEGSLSGKTFAVKDVFDIAGHTPGAGNPDWLRTHEPSARHADVINRLLSSGARLAGTTITDEIMYSINGENAHYGTPMNPKAPGRIPGGSSSGSAVAVSAGLADFAIGTDTGGSVRVPSAYCGIYGIRPTHGAVAAGGLIPLAPSFDTVGWMAQDAITLLDVGRVLLEQDSANSEKPFSKLLHAQDLWSLVDEHSSAAVVPYLQAINELFEQKEDVLVSADGLRDWMNAFRTIQGIEIWNEHRDWITRVKPAFGQGIAERFAWASTLKKEEHSEAYLLRESVRVKMEEWLGEDTLLVVPTVPAIAPLLNMTGAEVERRRVQTLEMSCVAGLAGLPQVTVPIKGELGCPIGISFIAGRNQDMRLLEWVASGAVTNMKQLNLG
ncbi:amidase [Paenibacillus paridis]|uniref:amidase n=1 Tax=Paenibacillus paridis TaxID=2583376 RepID=UPI0011216C1E|nr:amidase [Paenibacillus paridis]